MSMEGGRARQSENAGRCVAVVVGATATATVASGVGMLDMEKRYRQSGQT